MHELCNAYWLDTDSEQGCDLLIIKDATYGFNQNTDLVATLPPSPHNNFCASAKHNSSPNTYSIDSAAVISSGEGCIGASGSVKTASVSSVSEETKPDECEDLFFHDYETKGVSNADSFAGQGHYIVKYQGLAYLQSSTGANDRKDKPILDFWYRCRGLGGTGAKWNERKRGQKLEGKRDRGRYDIFFNAEDIRSLAHQSFHVREQGARQCISQQTACLNFKQGVSARTTGPADGTGGGGGYYGNTSKYYDRKNCDEVLSLSCNPEPVGKMNAPATGPLDSFTSQCESKHGELIGVRQDCTEKVNISKMCSRGSNALTLGCKGSVNEEIFEISCKNSAKAYRLGPWKDAFYRDTENDDYKAYFKEAACRSTGRLDFGENSACCKYVNDDPEITDQFG
jgi:hypothetical protein